VEFRRRGPSPTALLWVERALGHRFRVVASRRMTGGVTSAVHRLTVEGETERGYGDAWPRFLPVQVGGRVPVDTEGMTARIEELVESALRRLNG
jgi:hypothetical protein